MDRTFYVYCLFRPWNGEPCYIGKGSGRRAFRHAGHAGDHPNWHLAKILSRAGGDLPVVILHEGLTEAVAFEYERALISAIGRDIYGGPLANMTDGGEGAANPSTETREKIGAANRGRKQSPEHIARLVVSRIGRRLSPEAIEKVRAFQVSHTKSPEHCAAVSAAKKGRKLGPMSEARRAAHGAALRSRMRTPEEVARRSAALKQSWARRKSAIVVHEASGDGG